MHSHTKLKMQMLIWGFPGVMKDLGDLQIFFFLPPLDDFWTTVFFS